MRFRSKVYCVIFMYFFIFILNFSGDQVMIEAVDSREAENLVQIGAIADVTPTSTNIQRSKSTFRAQFGSFRIPKVFKTNPLSGSASYSGSVAHDKISFG